eukprot:TRINITY_DN3414_c0_g5_i1.p1 TRINITY_DN3414_c0_g5~~TRINITY_DN3414_c0_g5_i1.p1  ORF type:complete len:317 (+),score=79.59 TRINITY_DN3414_c0_g5_i1:251-1201(+)
MDDTRRLGVRHKKAASKFDYKLKQLCNPCSKVKSIEVNPERTSNFNSLIGNEGLLLERKNAENTFLSPRCKTKKAIPISINRVPKAVKVVAVGSQRESVPSAKQPAIPLNFEKQHKIAGASSALGFCYSSSPSPNASSQQIAVKSPPGESQRAKLKRVAESQPQMAFLKLGTKEKLKQVLKVCKQTPLSAAKSQSKERLSARSGAQIPTASPIGGASKKAGVLSEVKEEAPKSKCTAPYNCSHIVCEFDETDNTNSRSKEDKHGVFSLPESKQTVDAGQPQQRLAGRNAQEAEQDRASQRESYSADSRMSFFCVMR